MMATLTLNNPFRPGAGHMPPYLAGRKQEKQAFSQLLLQSIILKNMVLTGLRGVGKTVLLETFKPMAQKQGWLWVGTDLSESASLNENNLSTRLLTDLAVLTSSIVIKQREKTGIGFTAPTSKEEQRLDFQTLNTRYQQTPGLPEDKLKYVLESVWSVLKNMPHCKGIVFAYDEAQNLADHVDHQQFPLSLLLDTFQSLQRKNIPFMLALTGLPTLFPQLVEARTYAERMFSVVFLDKLTVQESKESILEPLKKHPIKLNDKSIMQIVELSGGYPYFVQFICREVYDAFIQQKKAINPPFFSVPTDAIIRKLDTDFFSGRWAKSTDRQRELLTVVATLDGNDTEFSVQDVVSQSKKRLEKPFSSSHANQMLSTLSNAGLIYKNRHGKYCFAVPLLGGFIKRQAANE